MFTCSYAFVAGPDAGFEMIRRKQSFCLAETYTVTGKTPRAENLDDDGQGFQTVRNTAGP
jgi:hypothetical protein